MRRVERVAVFSKDLRWEPLGKVLPQALEALGLAADDAATDGEITLRNRGEHGCVIEFASATLARRAALAVATRAGLDLMVYEVVGSAGEKRNRFRTTAHKASAKGELRPSEGKELDLEDGDQKWGGGSLADQAARVLSEFGHLGAGQVRSLSIGYKK
jgi:hypothetical protein